MRGLSSGIRRGMEQSGLIKKIDEDKSETRRDVGNKEVIDGAFEAAEKIARDGKIYIECKKIAGELIKKYGSIYSVPWEEYEEINRDFGVKYEVIAATCKKIWEEEIGADETRQ